MADLTGTVTIASVVNPNIKKVINVTLKDTIITYGLSIDVESINFTAGGGNKTIVITGNEYHNGILYNSTILSSSDLTITKEGTDTYNQISLNNLTFTAADLTTNLRDAVYLTYHFTWISHTTATTTLSVTQEANTRTENGSELIFTSPSIVEYGNEPNDITVEAHKFTNFTYTSGDSVTEQNGNCTIISTSGVLTLIESGKYNFAFPIHTGTSTKTITFTASYSGMSSITKSITQAGVTNPLSFVLNKTSTNIYNLVITNTTSSTVSINWGTITASYRSSEGKQTETIATSSFPSSISTTNSQTIELQYTPISNGTLNIVYTINGTTFEVNVTITV